MDETEVVSEEQMPDDMRECLSWSPSHIQLKLIPLFQELIAFRKATLPPVEEVKPSAD